MGGIIFIGAALTVSFFRKGGIYNKEPFDDEIKPDMASLDNEIVIRLKSPEPRKPTLTDLCTAMRDFEGGPGDANYKNHNPLNCKFYDGGYLPKYLPVLKSKGGFAIFKDYSTGWLYGYNMLKNKIKNHPKWTLRDLISDHAPAEDNNPVDIYTTFVAKRLAVDNDYLVKNLG